MKLGLIKEGYKNTVDKFYVLFNNNTAIMLTIVILLSIFSMSFKLGVGFSHPKFLPETIKVFFNFIALNAAVLSTLKNLSYNSVRKTILSQLFITLLICSAIFNTIVNYNDLLNQLVWIFYPTPLMTAILDDAAAIPWAFVVVGANVIISILLSLKNNRKVKGISKIVHNGLLVYSVLTISLWFVTHFSYVGSNYIYMANDLKIIDSLVENHLEKQMPLPKEFNLKVYDNYDTFKSDTFAVTTNEYKQDKITNPDLKWSKELILLNDWFNKLQESRLGLNVQLPVKSENVHDFTNWVFFVLNYAQIRMLPDKWIMCDLIFPPKVNSHSTMIKHGLFYVKIKEGKYYTYVEFSKTFKEKQQNLIFNLFYALFHVVYWICLLYLISHHKKKVFKNTKDKI